MTVEIIKRGQLPSERQYRTVCRDCNTIFTFHQSDVRDTSYDQREGGYHSIGCPVCSSIQLVNVANYIKPQSVDPY